MIYPQTRKPEQDPYRTKTGELIKRKADDKAPKSFQEMSDEERGAQMDHWDKVGHPLPLYGYAHVRIVVKEDEASEKVEVEAEKVEKGKKKSKHDADILS